MREFLSKLEFLRNAVCRSRHRPPGKMVSQSLLEVFRAGYSANYTVLSPEEFSIIRGRTSNTDAPFLRLSEIWYPPAESTRLYRANLGGKPVLYAASEVATTLAELRPKKGQFITAFEAEITRPVTLKMIERSEMFRSALKLSDDCLTFEEFAADLFSRAGDSPLVYVMSAALAGLFFMSGAIEGLMYRSVATKMKGVNVALSPMFADRYLKPVQFMTYEVTEVRGPCDFDIRCVAHSTTIKDGIIGWDQVGGCLGHSFGDIAQGNWRH